MKNPRTVRRALKKIEAHRPLEKDGKESYWIHTTMIDTLQWVLDDDGQTVTQDFLDEISADERRDAERN